MATVGANTAGDVCGAGIDERARVDSGPRPSARVIRSTRASLPAGANGASAKASAPTLATRSSTSFARQLATTSPSPTGASLATLRRGVGGLARIFA